MPGLHLLQADSGDGTSISVLAGRRISTVFQIPRRRGSGQNIISQSIERHEQEALMPCCRSHMGYSGTHSYFQGNRCIRYAAIGGSLVAADDYCSRHDRFYLMFRRIVQRYIGRIASLPDKVSIWQTFPTRGWILIVFMSCLGSVLKIIPGIPSAFSAL